MRLAIVAALVCTGALAQATEQDAQTFFAEGRRLREAGQCAAAIDQFQVALDAFPQGLGSLRNVAECQEELGRFASARRSYWALRREALRSDDEKYRGWDEDAERAHARLADKVARIVVTLVGDRRAPFVVRVDGEDLGPSSIGVELERDPGIHKVDLVQARQLRETQNVTVASGERAVVTLRLSTTADGPAPLPPPSSRRGADELPRASPRPLRIAGWTGVGLAIASGIGFGAALGVRADALADVEEVCPEHESRTCTPLADDAAARGRTASTLVNVFAAVGGGTAAVGISLLIADAVGDDGSVRGARAVVGLAPAGADLTLCF